MEEYEEQSRRTRTKHAFTSWHAFHGAIKLKSASSILANEDLLPSPPERQTWTVWNFFAYWYAPSSSLSPMYILLKKYKRWSESWAVSTWSLGSSLIALGATVRDALLVILFANLLSAVVIVLNGRAASRYHVGYPVLARTTFGIWGSYFFVVLRAILGVIWGECFPPFSGLGMID
jgi:NCS1 family nucleobase:cation symporter-1